MKWMLPALMLMTSCSWINAKLGLPDDNLVEETAECLIQAKTGVDIDLTPGSPE